MDEKERAKEDLEKELQAKSIIEEVIDPLLEYVIGGRLYSNLEQQIINIMNNNNKYDL